MRVGNSIVRNQSFLSVRGHTSLRDVCLWDVLQIRDQPVVGQLIPDSYLELEKRILEERTKLPVEFPVIDQKRLFRLVQENKLQLEENELPHAVQFLNESGNVHFQRTWSF